MCRYGRAEIIYSKREGHPRSAPGGADNSPLHASLSEMCCVAGRVVIFCAATQVSDFCSENRTNLEWAGGGPAIFRQ